MEASILSCAICFEIFDLSEHLPRSLTVCGHSVCSNCLNQIIMSEQQPKCPLDKLHLPQHWDLSMFPVNIIARQLLEAQIERDLCQIHQLEKKFLCVQEKRIICELCLDAHQEQGHRVSSLKPIEEKASNKRREINSFLEDVKNWHKSIIQVLEENKALCTKAVEQNINTIRASLDQQESYMKSEINVYADIMKSKLNSLLGGDSELFEPLLSKQSKLGKIRNLEEVLRILGKADEMKEDIEKWRNKMSTNEIRKMIQEDFTLIYSSIIKNFQNFKVNLPSVQLPSINTLEYLIKNFSEEVPQSKPNEDLNNLKTNTYLNFELADERCSVESNSKSQEILMNLAKWSKIKTFRLILTQKLSKHDTNLLGFLWRKMMNPLTLEFKLASGTVSNDLCRALAAGPTTFSSVSIDIEDYEINTNLEVLVFVKQTLLKAKNLESLTLKARKAIFPLKEETLKLLFKFGSFETSKLREFTLDFSHANILEKEIENFLFRMPNLRRITLNLANTKITNETLNFCSTNLLEGNNHLEVVDVDFQQNPITDDGIIFFLEKLSKLKGFGLRLNQTQITDKTTEVFCQILPSRFSELIYLQLGIDVAELSDKGIQRIFIPMPYLKRFILAVRGPLITDKTIENFVGNMLVYGQMLEELEIALLDTNVSDEGILKLSESLKDIRMLCLDLNSSKITDKSITILVNKLSKIRSLKNLVLKVHQSSVSVEVKKNVKDLVKKINKDF